MAESACLLRSYSSPSSSSPGTEQADLFRCLASSKSFGRYESDSLNWQKFSAFTENRVMEDVKKYSRPGSVARMKAYFEAYYKKQAADRAAALDEKLRAVNAVLVDVARREMHEEEERAPKDVQVFAAEENQLVENVENVQIVADEENQLVENVEDVEIVVAEENQLVENVEDVQIAAAEENQLVENVVDVQIVAAEENQLVKNVEDVQIVAAEEKQLVEKVDNVQGSVITSDQVDECGLFKSVEDNGKGASGEVKNTQRKAIGELGDPASLAKRKSVFSPFKSRGTIGVPKPPVPPKPSENIRKRQHIKANSGSRENAADVKNRKSATKSLHMSINLKANSGSRENAADVKNRKLATKSLHLSINLAPKETKETPLSPILRGLVNSKLVKTLAGKAAHAIQGKPLQGTVDISAHPPGSLQQKRISRLRSPRECTKNVQSPTVSCPFSFKSEERAAKRKEFFERLEQNAKAKEKEKDKLQEKSKVISFKSEERAIKRKEFFERLEQNAKAKEIEKDKLREKSKVISLKSEERAAKRKQFLKRFEQNANETEKVKQREKSKVISFKREERAAKRKEFFERLEQSTKVEKIEKDELQVKSKVKARSDFKYMHMLASSKVAPCPDSFRTRRTTNDASEVSCSPVVSGGETLKDNTNRPSLRLKAGCKEVRGKPNPSPAFLLKSVMKKYNRENTSIIVQLC